VLALDLLADRSGTLATKAREVVGLAAPERRLKLGTFRAPLLYLASVLTQLTNLHRHSVHLFILRSTLRSS